MALTNRNIQAQRLIEPQIPLNASRVVKWWAAVAIAEVDIVRVAGVYSRSSYDENCGERLEVLTLCARLGKLVEPQPL